MTDETKPSDDNAPGTPKLDPSNPPGQSLSERAATLVASVEHAMRHNAPITLDMLTEMKALLGYRAKAPIEGTGGPSGETGSHPVGASA